MGLFCSEQIRFGIVRFDPLEFDDAKMIVDEDRGNFQ